MVVTVVVAEDSYLMREGIVTALELDDDLEVAATSGSLDELVAAVEG